MLRDYQQKAVNEIRAAYSSGIRRLVLHLSTGSGKTVIFSHILTATAAKNKKCIMAVRGRQLVAQASERLTREGVEHAIYMAGHRVRSGLISICSIDTLNARGVYPEADLVVIDECHMATSAAFVKFCSNYSDKFILGVSATPFCTSSLEHVGQKVIKPITMDELVALGFLVPLKYYAPRTPDFSRVRTVRGDFDQGQIAALMNESSITGDVVAEWLRLGEMRPTICFAVNVAHSRAISESFRLAGVLSAHLDATHSLEYRGKILKMLENGELKVVTNCGVLCTGVDMPYAACIILCRPTKSYNLHIQQMGRGTRPSDGKKDCFILDHAGNVTRHGFINEERTAYLDGKPKDETRPAPSTCPVCFVVWFKHESGPSCPSCGWTPRENEIREFNRVDGELVEIIKLTREQEAVRDMKLWKKEAKERGFKKGWAYFKIVTKYGSEMAETLMPKRILPPWVTKKYGQLQ